MVFHSHHNVRTFYKGTSRIRGSKYDDDSEEDTIPAKLQSNEMVVPRPYVHIVDKFLHKQKLPLPMPSKVEKVMHEFKLGQLHDGHGKIVTNKKQALAIALDVARKYHK